MSGLSHQQQLFQRVISILDSELRIITPTESPLGELAGLLATSTGSNAATESLVPEKSDARFYQLTHDYLVAPLRVWLTQKDRQTFRGRARVALLEQAGRWQAFGRKNADLPGFFSLVTMLMGTSSADMDARAAEMLRVACLQKLVRRSCVTLFFLWPLLQIALIVLVLVAVYLTRHAAAEGDLVGAALVELAGPLSLSTIVSLLIGIVFIRRVTLFGLWWSWRHNWSFGLRPLLLMLLLGTMLTLPVLGFLRVSSALPAVGALAEQRIAEQLKAGQADVALAHLARAIEEFPMPKIYLQRARLRLARKEYESVIADSTLALDAGTAESSKWIPGAGIAYSRRFTSLSFNAAEAHFLRAEAHRSMGRTDAATDDLLQVLRRDANRESSFFGPAVVSLWRVSPHLFWLQSDRESLARGLGQTAVQDPDPSMRRDALRILGQLG